MNIEPIPSPTINPWERYNCQISFANDAATKPPAIKRTPVVITAFLPISLVKMVHNGATNIAAPNVMPPMKA
jgi:hypothetical protein